MPENNFFRKLFFLFNYVLKNIKRHKIDLLVLISSSYIECCNKNDVKTVM